MTIKEYLASVGNYYQHYKFLPGNTTREYCISALISILIDMSGFASTRLEEDNSYFLCVNDFIKDVYNIQWSDTTISDYLKDIKNRGIISVIMKNKAGHNLRYVKMNNQILIDMYNASNQNLSSYNQNLIDDHQDLYGNNNKETRTSNNKDTITPVLDKKDKYTKEKELRAGIDDVIAYFNSTCGTNYRATVQGTIKHIKARLNEGFSLQDLKDVILFKYNEWGRTPVRFSNGQLSSNYLRPSTLFNSKFEEYLQQAKNSKNSEGVIISKAPSEERTKEVY